MAGVALLATACQQSGSGAAPASGGGGSSKCTVGMLKAEFADGQSAMSISGAVLIFTNTSSQSCTLQGYPGLKLVGAPSSTEWPSAHGEPVTLRPGGRAHADFHYYNDYAYPNPSKQCGPRPTGILVTPPNSYTSMTLPWSKRACQGGALVFESPVQPGPGQYEGNPYQ